MAATRMGTDILPDGDEGEDSDSSITSASSSPSEGKVVPRCSECSPANAPQKTEALATPKEAMKEIPEQKEEAPGTPKEAAKKAPSQKEGATCKPTAKEEETGSRKVTRSDGTGGAPLKEPPGPRKTSGKPSQEETPRRTGGEGAQETGRPKAGPTATGGAKARAKPKAAGRAAKATREEEERSKDEEVSQDERPLASSASKTATPGKRKQAPTQPPNTDARLRLRRTSEENDEDDLLLSDLAERQKEKQRAAERLLKTLAAKNAKGTSQTGPSTPAKAGKALKEDNPAGHRAPQPKKDAQKRSEQQTFKGEATAKSRPAAGPNRGKAAGGPEAESPNPYLTPARSHKAKPLQDRGRSRKRNPSSSSSSSRSDSSSSSSQQKHEKKKKKKRDKGKRGGSSKRHRSTSATRNQTPMKEVPPPPAPKAVPPSPATKKQRPLWVRPIYPPEYAQPQPQTVIKEIRVKHTLEGDYTRGGALGAAAPFLRPPQPFMQMPTHAPAMVTSQGFVASPQPHLTQIQTPLGLQLVQMNPMVQNQCTVDGYAAEAQLQHQHMGYAPHQEIQLQMSSTGLSGTHHDVGIPQLLQQEPPVSRQELPMPEAQPNAKMTDMPPPPVPQKARAKMTNMPPLPPPPPPAPPALPTPPPKPEAQSAPEAAVSKGGPPELHMGRRSKANDNLLRAWAHAGQVEREMRSRTPQWDTPSTGPRRDRKQDEARPRHAEETKGGDASKPSTARGAGRTPGTAGPGPARPPGKQASEETAGTRTRGERGGERRGPPGGAAPHRGENGGRGQCFRPAHL